MIWFLIEVFLLIFLILLGPRYGIRSLTIKIFNIMWCGGLAFSNLGLFELYKPSSQTNLLFVFAILAFNITYNLVRDRCEYSLENVNDDTTELKNTSIKLGMLLVANVVVIAICLPFIPKAWSIYQLHGMTYLRGLVYTQSEEYFSNVYISLLFQWIIQPFLQFVLLIAASQINHIVYNKRLFAIAVVDLCMEMLLFGGGRRTIIMFFLQMVIFYLLKNPIKLSRYVKINLKKLGIILGAIMMILIIIEITASRLTKISVGESLFQYYVGPYIFFDKITNGGNSCSLFTNNTYGACTFSFFIVPFNILKMLFGAGYNSSAAQILNNNLDTAVYIGEHSIHNAHATSLIYFCSDYGFLFSFIGMIVFAIILAYFTTRYKKNNRFLVLAVYFASLAFYSAQTYPFTGIIQYVVILLTILFIKNVNPYEEITEY